MLLPCKKFQKISDWFYRVEYKQRNSPNIHELIWLEDAPVHGCYSDDDTTSFIDQIITCEKPVNDPELGLLACFFLNKIESILFQDSSLKFATIFLMVH